MYAIVVSDVHLGYDSKCNVKAFEDLPANAQSYINYISNELGLPICLVSVGPDRKQTIDMMDEAQLGVVADFVARIFNDGLAEKDI